MLQLLAAGPQTAVEDACTLSALSCFSVMTVQIYSAGYGMHSDMTAHCPQTQPVALSMETPSAKWVMHGDEVAVNASS